MQDIELNKFAEKELREQLELDQKDIEIVLEYQELFPSLLVSCERGSFAVDSEKLWNELGQPYSTYRQWFSRKISKHYQKGEHFLVVYQKFDRGKMVERATSVGLGASEEMQLVRRGYFKNRFFTINAAIDLISHSYGFIGERDLLKLLTYLSILSGKRAPILITNRRREEGFGLALRGVLSQWGLEDLIKPQAHREGYVVDFIFDDVIYIEYDEFAHKYRVEEDKFRMREISEKSNNSLQWIRVHEGREGEGLGEIVKLLIEKGYINA